MISEAATTKISENNTHDISQNNPKSPQQPKETATERLARLKHEQWLEKERAKQETLLAKAEAEKQAAKARADRRAEAESLKVRKAELEQFIVDAINDRFCIFPFPPEIKPKLWAEDNGEKRCVLLNDKTNTCKSVVMSVVKDEITRYSYRLGGEQTWKEYGAWTDKQIESCYRRWKHFTHPDAKPRPWAFKSDPALTFHRHEFDPDPTVPMPLCEEFLGRLEDADTFMAWVGSLFVTDSYSQQYFYIQGGGGESKGTISRLLYAIFQEACFNIQKPSTDRFFGVMYADKRLVILDDLEDTAFMQSGLFKSLTGGGQLQLERKRIDAVNSEFEGKILITSNLEPNIKAAEHDLRRILWSKMRPLPTGVKRIAHKAYDRLVYQEAPAFIGRCIEAYNRRCPNHEELVQSDKIREQIESFASDDDNDSYAGFCDEFFQFGDPHSFVPASTVRDLIANKWPKRPEKTLLTEFKKWVTENHGVQVKSKKMKGINRKVYFGMRLMR